MAHYLIVWADCLNSKNSMPVSTYLPISFYNSTSIRELDLSNNVLFLSLPSNLSSWSKMTVLSLTNTFAYGNLMGMCDLQYLAELELGNDYITGSIPNCFSTSMLSLQL